MTITKVVLENFKSHSRTEIPLRPLTVLVGPNSVGKTSVLEAIEWIVGPAMSNEIAFFASDPSERRKLRFGASEMVLQVDGPIASESQLWLGIARDDAGEYSQTRSWKNKGAKGSRTALSSGVQELDAEFNDIRRSVLGAASLLRFEREQLVSPSTVEFGRLVSSLDEWGGGLAGVLAVTKLFRPEVFGAIVAALRQVVPSVEDIHVASSTFTRKSWTYHGPNEPRTEENEELNGAELRFDFVGARDITAKEVSEGTLIALGILTAALTGPDGPRVILLDDIERALHPRAQRELIRMLRQIIADNPQLQIIATSHSPYLVDEFEPEEVIVFAQRKDGSSAARPLSEHPRIKQALEVLTTGEFLAAEEEAWVTGESDG